MSYIHGIQISENPTSLLPPVESDAGIPFIVGTAPVNMTDETNVNKPKIIHNYAEAVAAFGYVAPESVGSTGLKKHSFTLCEFMKSHFALFRSAPVVMVNVLDPSKATHKEVATAQSITFDETTASVKVAEKGIILSSITLATNDKLSDATPKFTAAFDEEGYLIITCNYHDVSGTSTPYYTLGESVTFSANKLKVAGVADTDIIGGVSAAGVKTGLSLVEEVYPRFNVVPGVLLAPGFSSSASVAASLSSHAANINDVFKAGLALIDAPTGTSGGIDCSIYSNVNAWKNANNIINANQVVCYPLLNNDGVIYHMSTQLAGLIQQVDGENESVPYVSPSNKNFVCTGAVLENGNEVFFDQSIAASLNGQGIVTALNFIGGWKCWGNRTACYPANTDVKDCFIPIRRMFAWIANTIVLSYWSKVDNPINRRQIDSIVDSVNMWFNGLAARQYILGGRIEFIDSENPSLNLMDGKVKFHCYITPPTPNREIDFVLEYDPEYLSNLFE